jgi:hypothetical protein
MPECARCHECKNPDYFIKKYKHCQDCRKRPPLSDEQKQERRINSLVNHEYIYNLIETAKINANDSIEMIISQFVESLICDED